MRRRWRRGRQDIFGLRRRRRRWNHVVETPADDASRGKTRWRNLPSCFVSLHRPAPPFSVGCRSLENKLPAGTFHRALRNVSRSHGAWWSYEWSYGRRRVGQNWGAALGSMRRWWSYEWSYGRNESVSRGFFGLRRRRRVDQNCGAALGSMRRIWSYEWSYGRNEDVSRGIFGLMWRRRVGDARRIGSICSFERHCAERGVFGLMREYGEVGRYGMILVVICIATPWEVFCHCV